MSATYALVETATFTITHARHMAAKVATDLKRMQRFYGSPSDRSIANYEEEVIQLLKAGFLGVASYGFRRDGDWIEPALFYTAVDLAGAAANDDDPGRVRPGANISDASFYSYMTYSSRWDELTLDQQNAFKESLPFCRNGAPEPSVSGYLERDRTYSSGGRALLRATVRTWQ